MTTQFFLYRRLSRWITCEFELENHAKVALSNKYEIASFKDVFCHPFYWQAFQWLKHSPKLIVDCGAHCGHFSILIDLCLKSKFGVSEANYVLVEPNPHLLAIIQKNLTDAALLDRANIHSALLGARSGTGKLWINSKNYLGTGLFSHAGATPVEVPFLDLAGVVQDQTIDLMKIDIEGGEFEFVRSNLHLLKQVNLLFMEVHQAEEQDHQELFQSLQSVGLHPVAQPIAAYGQQLIIFQRQIIA